MSKSPESRSLLLLVCCFPFEHCRIRKGRLRSPSIRMLGHWQASRQFQGDQESTHPTGAEGCAFLNRSSPPRAATRAASTTPPSPWLHRQTRTKNPQHTNEHTTRLPRRRQNHPAQLHPHSPARQENRRHPQRVRQQHRHREVSDRKSGRSASRRMARIG